MNNLNNPGFDMVKPKFFGDKCHKPGVVRGGLTFVTKKWSFFKASLTLHAQKLGVGGWLDSFNRQARVRVLSS